MGVAWLAPSALAGLALVALPVLVHLLARQQGPTRAFPSLRFVSASSMTAMRRRRLDEWLLLACRCAIVASAALAMAGPVFLFPWRHEAASRRLAQAVIVEGRSSAEPTALQDPSAFRSVVLASDRAGNAVGRAARWFGAQPTSSRELVIAGPFSRGAVSVEDLAELPPDVGIRFVRLDGDAPPREVTVPRLSIAQGRVGIERRAVQLADDQTTVTEAGFQPLSQSPVRVQAPPASQSLADAALQAALTGGVAWREGAGDVTLTLENFSPANATATMASAIVNAVRPPAFREPARMTDAELAALSRPIGTPPASDVLVDEGDRRWLWALVLGLIAIEWRLRQARPVESEAREVKVA